MAPFLQPLQTHLRRGASRARSCTRRPSNRTCATIAARDRWLTSAREALVIICIGFRGETMAVRKTSKPRSRRSAATQFLVVRGRGSAVLIARVQFTAKKPVLAKAIDRLRAGKGVGKARGAFIVSGR